MDRKVARTFLALVLAFVSTADGMKCHMCTSHNNDKCRDPSKSDLQPVECDVEHMSQWLREVQSTPLLSGIAQVFEFDMPKQHQPMGRMACAKMDVKITGQEVTLRSCQPAKSEFLDSCKSAKKKVEATFNAMDYCDLCEGDGCNGSLSVMSPPRLVIAIPLAGALILRAMSRVP